VWAVLGRGEKRTGRGAVEDGEADAALTWAREAVRRPSDDGKAVMAEELGGGGSRAWRGEEESGDRCGEGRARTSAFYRAGGRWRRRGLNGRRQCRALKTPVTRSEGGGFKAELEHATELRRRRPFGLSMAREEGNAAAHGRLRSAGSVKEEGEWGVWSGLPAQPAGPDWSAGPDGRWAGGKKKENRNLFQN
jgi:hypothetical protein